MVHTHCPHSFSRILVLACLVVAARVFLGFRFFYRGELWKTVMINSLHVFDEVGYDIRVDNLRKSGKR